MRERRAGDSDLSLIRDALSEGYAAVIDDPDAPPATIRSFRLALAELERLEQDDERHVMERDSLGRAILADYDRRMATRRGRFLLWLLRKTT